MSRNRAQTGFTLLELVLVMVIIAIALAAVAPKLRGWSRGQDLHNEADQIVFMTRYARAQAVSDGQMYRLTIDPQAGTYALTKLDGVNYVQAKGDFGDTRRLPDGYRIAVIPQPGVTTTSNTVDFYPSGRTQVAQLRLTAANGDISDVVCSSAAEEFTVATGGQVTQ